MRKTLLTVIAGTVLLTSGAYAALFTPPKVIFRKGSDTWVKITKGNPKVGPFEHPHELPAAELSRVLRSIKFFSPSAFSLSGKDGEEQALFEESDMAIMAGPLSQALAQAGTDEWVDFSLTVFRGPQFFGSFRQTDGVLFWKEGKLQIAFRNVSAKTEPGQTLNTYDPTKGYRSLSKPVAGEGIALKAENWVVIDTAAVPVVTPAPEHAPVVAPPPKTVKDRLLELEQLKKDGLISEEEYQRKRKAILDEL